MKKVTRTHRKQNTRTKKGSAQSRTQKAPRRPISQLWKFVGVVSILLNFWLSYLALRPNVSVDYASNFIPKNEIALPVRVTNNGLLPVRVIRYALTDNLRTTRGNTIAGNAVSIDTFESIAPKGSVERVFDVINVDDSPSSGWIRVIVHYRFFFFPSMATAENTFRPYKNKDGTVRWITIPSI